MKIAEKILDLLEAKVAPRKSRSSQGRDDVSHKADIKKMDNETFKLRREVIDIIHELKKLDSTLPRIKVRIVDNTKDTRDKGTLAFAFVSKDTIFIDSQFIKSSGEDIFFVVAHEIIHATYGVRHVADKKDIMHFESKEGKSKSWVNSEFTKWKDRYISGKIKKNGYIDDAGDMVKWA